MNAKQKYFEYLLSRHYLKRLLEAKIISYAEFDEIDRLNKEKFLCKESQPKKDKFSTKSKEFS